MSGDVFAMDDNWSDRGTSPVMSLAWAVVLELWWQLFTLGDSGRARSSSQGGVGQRGLSFERRGRHPQESGGLQPQVVPMYRRCGQISEL